MPTEHDPFAPHHTVSRADSPDADDFPEARLLRAGIDADHVARLSAWFDSADPEERHTWREGVRSAPDQALGRFTTPEGMDLGDLTKDQLEDLLRARELPVSGNKPDLIQRLTQETPSEPLEATGDGPGAPEPGAAGNGGQAADGGDGGPPPNEQPTTPEPVTGAQQPPDPAQEAAPQATAPQDQAPQGEAAPQGQPGAPQEPSHEPPVTAPSAPQEPTARRSTHRSGGTGRGH